NPGGFEYPDLAIIGVIGAEAPCRAENVSLSYKNPDGHPKQQSLCEPSLAMSVINRLQSIELALEACPDHVPSIVDRVTRKVRAYSLRSFGNNFARRWPRSRGR